MKRMLIKVLSTLLAVAMLAGAAPLSGFIGLSLPDLRIPDSIKSTVQNIADGVYSLAENTASAFTLRRSSCGDSLVWSLDSDGTLTVSGTGNMDNYIFNEYYTGSANGLMYSPWYTQASKIKKIVIEEGVTSIGENAFRNCFAAETVFLPESLCNIGSYAFEHCVVLGEITITAGVEYIEDYAFANCASLKSVVFSEGLEGLGDYSFQYCRSLTEVNIPGSVAYIGCSAFESCSSLKTVRLNEGIWEIDSYSFRYCEALTEIDIPDGMEYIGNQAFYNCRQLERVTMTDSITEIGSYAFANCCSLKSIRLSENITSLKEFTFLRCTKLKKFIVPKNLVSIAYGGFSGCAIAEIYNLSSLTITAGDNGNGEIALHANRIYTDAESQSRLFDSNGFTFMENNGEILLVGYSGTATQPVLPSSVVNAGNTYTGYNIGAYAFYKEEKITSVTIPDCVEIIGKSAFEGCIALERADLGEGVRFIDNNAFMYCDALTLVSLPAGLTEIGEGAFYESGLLGALKIPASTQVIGISAFAYTDISSAEVSASVALPNNVFCGCSRLASIEATGENAVMVSVDGVLYSEDKTVLLTYPAGKSDASYTVPAGTVSIEKYAFNYNYNIQSVVLPETLESIGSNAFYSCTALKSINIPSKVSKIYNTTFDSCASLT